MWQVEFLILTTLSNIENLEDKLPVDATPTEESTAQIESGTKSQLAEETKTGCFAV